MKTDSIRNNETKMEAAHFFFRIQSLWTATPSTPLRPLLNSFLLTKVKTDLSVQLIAFQITVIWNAKK